MTEHINRERRDPSAPLEREPVPLRPVERLEPMASLPHPLTRFIGRDQEIAAIEHQVSNADVQLLTLTGPGGVGKTRLARHVSSRVGASFDHVWFIPLASVRDSTLVAFAIGQALGLSQSVDRPLAREVRLLLGDRTALLVLDNFEQVLEAGPTVAELLSACETLTILVTSRASLRISGEHLHPVPPMALPETGNEAVDMVREFEGIRLFIERATEQGSGFALTPQNVQAVVDICRRLDGLPLAIELAAARVGAFSPRTILDRLDQRLSLLADGPRDQPPRLRSMRDSIAWSHDLLGHDEQVLFRRLAVFLGGWTLDAAEAVAAVDGHCSRAQFLDRISSLVSKSLIRHGTGSDGTSRYTMLETIREFAREQLEQYGDVAEAQAPHAAYFLALAEQIDWGWFKPIAEGEACLARLDVELANIRVALAWFRQSGDEASVMCMAGQLGGLWVVRGNLDEGRQWLESSLVAGGDVDDAIRAKAMGTLSWIANSQGRSKLAFDLAEQGLAIFRSERHAIGTIYCLALSGMAARNFGDFDRAFERPREALSLLALLHGRPAWTRNMVITLHAALGHTALLQSDIAQATMHYNTALDLQVIDGHSPGTSHSYGNHVLAGLGDIARATGHHADAIPHYHASLQLAWRNHDVRAVVQAIGGIAGSLAAIGRHVPAARLFGASDALHAAYGFRFALETFDRQRALGLPEPWARAQDGCGIWQRLHDAVQTQYSLTLPSVTDARTVSDQWEIGQRLSLADAVTEALSVTLHEQHPAPDSSVLSPRELEILGHLAEGHTDQQIANQLYLSRRTVNAHVAHILTKLDAPSRRDAVALARGRGVLSPEA